MVAAVAAAATSVNQGSQKRDEFTRPYMNMVLGC